MFWHIWGEDDFFVEDLGDEVIMGIELTDGGSRVEAEQIDFIVDARDSKGLVLLVEESSSCQTALADEEALLSLKCLCTVLLDEAIEGSGHEHDWLLTRLVLLHFVSLLHVTADYDSCDLLLVSLWYMVDFEFTQIFKAALLDVLSITCQINWFFIVI